MASQKVVAALESIESSSGQQNKSQLYNDLLSHIISSSAGNELAHDLIYYLDSILGETISTVVARTLLESFIKALRDLPPEVKIKVGEHAVSRLESRSASVEEQDASIKEILADTYESQEEYIAAARALGQIHLDSSQRLISDASKIRMWIRILRLYLEEGDTTSAQTFLKKIKSLPSKIEDPELKLHFQLSQARILDANRSFLEASLEYFNVSLATGVDESDRLQALVAAIICAVLAPAGPQRSRTLARLYKDDRATSVGEFGILEKMYLDRLLTPEEVTAFSKKLAPHQLARMADGSTVLDKAVIEHNLVAASKLYDNIRTESLAAILGLSSSGDMTAGEKAEAYAAHMVQQGRLKGSIDQIDGVIYFDSGIAGVGNSESTGRSLRLWEAGVQGVAEDIERVAARVNAEFPVSSTAL
jgi:COP9 signalosome complex subunit 4